jgi:hypothetical protein
MQDGRGQKSWQAGRARQARISAFAMRKNNDMRLPQICLGFPCNWHTLDKIVRHNRPRKVKNAFRGQISAKKAANCCIDSSRFLS